MMHWSLSRYLEGNIRIEVTVFGDVVNVKLRYPREFDTIMDVGGFAFRALCLFVVHFFLQVVVVDFVVFTCPREYQPGGTVFAAFALAPEKVGSRYYSAGAGLEDLEVH